jgi:hypothetical protein
VVYALAANTEFLDQFEVRFAIFACNVLQVALALADQLQQAAAGGVIVLVGLQVLGEFLDTLGHDAGLHGGRTGVVFASLQVFNDTLLLLT